MTLTASEQQQVDVASLTVDLRAMVATETPESEWVDSVTWLVGRPLSANEKDAVVHTCKGYRDAPWSDLWKGSIRRVARVLVYGGLS